MLVSTLRPSRTAQAETPEPMCAITTWSAVRPVVPAAPRCAGSTTHTRARGIRSGARPRCASAPAPRTWWRTSGMLGVKRRVDTHDLRPVDARHVRHRAVPARVAHAAARARSRRRAGDAPHRRRAPRAESPPRRGPAGGRQRRHRRPARRSRAAQRSDQRRRRSPAASSMRVVVVDHAQLQAARAGVDGEDAHRSDRRGVGRPVRAHPGHRQSRISGMSSKCSRT